MPVVTCTPVSGCSITPERIFTCIRLLALGGEARLAGPAAIEIALDLFRAKRNLRRAAVDHAADRDPVAFAEGRDPKHVAEGVERHWTVDGLRLVDGLRQRGQSALTDVW